MPNEALKKQVGGQHYKNLAIQPAEYCQKNRLSYCESSVIQYVTRHREKNGAEDIKKAIHCLELLLELEYSDAPQAKAKTRPNRGEEVVVSQMTKQESAVERARIEAALKLSGGNKKQAAKRLGMGRQTLYTKLALYKIYPRI